MKAAAVPVGNALDVDARLRAPRRPHADARLRGDARGRDGGVRKELAAGVVQRDWEVRFRGQTGKHLLVLSITGFERFCYPQYDAVRRRKP